MESASVSERLAIGRLAPVSIIVPAYNCASYIGEAIDSALNQTRPPLEVIVVDDGSTDATARVLEPYRTRVRIEHQQNAGVSAARNRGAALAKGDWVLFLDADDALAPTALEDMLRVTSDQPQCVVYGDRVEMTDAGVVFRDWPSRECTGPVPRAGITNFDAAAFSPGSAIVPKWLAEKVGGFDRRFSTCADRHFWIRCGAICEFKYCGSIVFRYRDRTGSMSKDHALNATERVRVQVDALEWCRQQGVALFNPPPSGADLLGAQLHDVYYARRWKSVDALLALAAELHADNPEIGRIRRLRRLPTWLVAFRDALDRLRGGASPRSEA